MYPFKTCHALYLNNRITQVYLRIDRVQILEQSNTGAVLAHNVNHCLTDRLDAIMLLNSLAVQEGVVEDQLVIG